LVSVADTCPGDRGFDPYSGGHPSRQPHEIGKRWPNTPLSWVEVVEATVIDFSCASTKARFVLKKWPQLADI